MPRIQPIPISEDRPYSEVVVTMQVRILHDKITRSRVSANIHPDPALKRIATKELEDEQYGTNDRGDFVVNFSEHWLDLNGDYPRISSAKYSFIALRISVFSSSPSSSTAP